MRNSEIVLSDLEPVWLHDSSPVICNHIPRTFSPYVPNILPLRSLRGKRKRAVAVALRNAAWREVRHRRQRPPWLWRGGAKSLLIFRICQAPESKIFRWSRRANHWFNLAHPGPHEGRFAIVTKRRAGDAMDALASGACLRAGRKRRSVRPSRVVLAPRCWRQALRGVFRKVTVTTSPLTGESTK